MNVEWGTLGQWAGPLVAILISLWAAFSSRDQKALDELKADRNTLFKRVDDVERDVATIKVDIKHLPTKDEFHELDNMLASLDAKFDAMLDKMDVVIAQNERAQDRLAEREDREREARR